MYENKQWPAQGEHGTQRESQAYFQPTDVAAEIFVDIGVIGSDYQILVELSYIAARAGSV